MATERLSCEKGHVVSFGSGGTLAKIIEDLRIKQNKQDVAIPSSDCSQCKEEEMLKTYADRKKSHR